MKNFIAELLLLALLGCILFSSVMTVSATYYCQKHGQIATGGVYCDVIKNGNRTLVPWWEMPNE